MTSIERMYALYKAIDYVIESNISGDFVECGVWKGGSAMFMALCLIKHQELTRTIHLYDTFSGMPEPTSKDLRLGTNIEAINRWKESQKDKYNEWAYCSLEDVKRNMMGTKYPKDKLNFIK